MTRKLTGAELASKLIVLERQIADLYTRMSEAEAKGHVGRAAQIQDRLGLAHTKRTRLIQAQYA
jgi:hypothetical protein